ncbi:hypothetical protein PsYK624_150740 [Phanerochaete sordida]|uniref:Uncharacterized protein n=1 Tax=Phanerochaete sordida TaxID=48140 RepID=A0A9P3GNN0_9APHY|nr:hypothetical protein PsYK624_150740 [Phanerochaete sordida]
MRTLPTHHQRCAARHGRMPAPYPRRRPVRMLRELGEPEDYQRHERTARGELLLVAHPWDEILKRVEKRCGAAGVGFCWDIDAKVLPAVWGRERRRARESSS